MRRARGFCSAAVLVAIGNPEINKFEVIRGADYYRLRKSKIENRAAGVVQWQNGSFPSCTRGFDSPHPLFFIFPSKRYFKRWIVPKLIALRPIFWIRLTREWPNPC